jgi:hypothetical protein
LLQLTAGGAVDLDQCPLGSELILPYEGR